jgi:hypothetical protein
VNDMLVCKTEHTKHYSLICITGFVFENRRNIPCDYIVAIKTEIILRMLIKQ